MNRAGKYSLFIWVVFFAASTFAYCGSPYSANGIGTLIPDDYGRSRGMGGAGIANTGEMNLLRDNPALLSTFSSFSFSAGASYDRTNTYLGGDEQPTYAKTNLNMIKVVLPTWKNVVFGWGLTPYSRSDCNIAFPEEEGDISTLDTMKSTGGINVSSAAFAWSFREILSLGVSFDYYFGMIEEDWVREFPDTDDYYDSYTYIKRKYRGYGQTYGMLLHVSEKMSLGLGYVTKSTVSYDKSVLMGSLTSPETLLESIDISLPETWRFGVYSKLRERLEAGLDISLSNWKDAATTDTEKEMYSDTYRIGGGIRYTPSTRINAPYYMTLPVSLGFRMGTLYYKSYPVIDTIEEKAVTAGIEFPLRSNTGVLALTFEYGIRGEKSKNGWDEDFFSFGLALSGKIR